MEFIFWLIIGFVSLYSIGVYVIYKNKHRETSNYRQDLNINNTSDLNKEVGFQKHPSTILNNLYKAKNYQGANPIEASILFVGRDPNWAIDIESMPVSNYITEYLVDGINFWKTYNIHHPFLLPEYKGDGKRYHTMFSKLKLDSKFSSEISFVELLGFPTTGMAKKNNKRFKNYLLSDFNRGHLIHLDSIINNNKSIFIAWGLIDDFQFLYKHTGLFGKLAKLDKSKMDISDLNQFDNIFIHKHFSDSISNSTIDKISEKVLNIFREKNEVNQKSSKPVMSLKNKWLYPTDDFGKMENGIE